PVPWLLSASGRRSVPAIPMSSAPGNRSGVGLSGSPASRTMPAGDAEAVPSREVERGERLAASGVADPGNARSIGAKGSSDGSKPGPEADGSEMKGEELDGCPPVVTVAIPSDSPASPDDSAGSPAGPVPSSLLPDRNVSEARGSFSEAGR